VTASTSWSTESEVSVTDRVQVAVDEAGVATVTLTRPEKHNALDGPMLDAIIAAAHQVRDDRRVRAVVLHGAGKSFCSGIDIQRLGDDPPGGRITIAPGEDDYGNRGQQATCRWAAVPAPVIAAIHGYCLGGGAQIALGADIRIAAPDAKIAIFETNWGLVPDMGLAHHLPRLVRFDIAQELIFSGRTLSGTEAANLGLVTRVAEDPLTAAVTLAVELAAKSPDAIQTAKRLMHEAWRRNDPARLLRREAVVQQRLIEGTNHQMAVASRKAGQTPTFRDRTITLD
jgi:enoyl-CoA hydratase/carnithine racemase